MTSTNISEFASKMLQRALQSTRLAALLIAATFASTVSAMPAQAQNGDTWKSIAIIGGSTAAGAIIGHKVAGSKGAYIGAAVGAAGGYAIDRRRRQSEYNNEYGYNNGGYNGNDPYYGNGGYDAGPYGYPNGYQNSNNYAHTRSYRRR